MTATPNSAAGVVPFVDLGRHLDPLRDELQDAFACVLKSGDFILGEELEMFEREFSHYVGVEEAIGVGSGTAAITIALQATGMGRGDEVIVPAHTYIASALGVLHAGAIPVFCDVETETGLIDLDSAAANLSERTAAIMTVHLYGQACDMDRVGQFAERHGLAVLEDAAQAHGATWRGRRAGSFGAAASFSFYPSKNLGALGDGGMVCTNDSGIAAAARCLRNVGQRAKGEHAVAGYNERLDTLQAAMLRVKLRYLEEWNSARREAARLYQGRLPATARALPDRSEAQDVFHLFPVRVADRDRVAQKLRDAGVRTGIHYSPAVHHQPPFTDPAFDCPQAVAWAAEELSLPMFPYLTEAEIQRTCEALEGAENASADAGTAGTVAE